MLFNVKGRSFERVSDGRAIQFLSRPGFSFGSIRNWKWHQFCHLFTECNLCSTLLVASRPGQVIFYFDISLLLMDVCWGIYFCFCCFNIFSSRMLSPCILSFCCFPFLKEPKTHYSLALVFKEMKQISSSQFHRRKPLKHYLLFLAC